MTDSEPWGPTSRLVFMQRSGGPSLSLVFAMVRDGDPNPLVSLNLAISRAHEAVRMQPIKGRHVEVLGAVLDATADKFEQLNMSKLCGRVGVPWSDTFYPDESTVWYPVSDE